MSQVPIKRLSTKLAQSFGVTPRVTQTEALPSGRLSPDQAADAHVEGPHLAEHFAITELIYSCIEVARYFRFLRYRPPVLSGSRFLYSGYSH
jgi:hypothetical protein